MAKQELELSTSLYSINQNVALNILSMGNLTYYWCNSFSPITGVILCLKTNLYLLFL